MKIEHRLGFETVADFVRELANGSIPFCKLLPFFCRLETSLSLHTTLPDRALAPTLLRRLAWSRLERVSREIRFSGDPRSVWDKDLEGLEASVLAGFWGPLPPKITGEGFEIRETREAQKIARYLHAASGYRFGVHALFEEGGRGKVHFIWTLPCSGKEIQSNFKMGEELQQSLQNARAAAGHPGGYCILMDLPGAPAVEGPSLGLAAYLSLQARKRGKRISPGLAVTGAMEQKWNGWEVRGVGDIFQKVEAAAVDPFGIEEVLVPAANGIEAAQAARGRLEVVPISFLAEMDRLPVFVEDRMRVLERAATVELDPIRRLFGEEFSNPLRFFASRHYLPPIVKGKKGTANAEEMVDAMIHRIEGGHRRFLITGEAGSGKTLFLLRLAYLCFDPHKASGRLGLEPYFLRAQDIFVGENGKAAKAEEIRKKVRQYAGLSARGFNRPGILLLIDGLDEVHLESGQERDCLIQFIQGLPNNPWVVFSARPQEKGRGERSLTGHRDFRSNFEELEVSVWLSEFSDDLPPSLAISALTAAANHLRDMKDRQEKKFYNQAESLLNRLGEDQARKDCPKAYADILHNRGRRHYDKGEYADALRDYRNALEALPKGAEGDRLYLFRSAANVFLDLFDLPLTLKCLDLGLELSQREKDPRCLGITARVALKAGQWYRAVELMQQKLGLHGDRGEKEETVRDQNDLALALSFLYRKEKDPKVLEKARELLEWVAKEYTDDRRWGDLVYVHRYRACLELWAQNRKSAVKAVEGGLRLYEDGLAGDLGPKGHLLLVRGQMEMAEGRNQEARDSFQGAAEAFKEYDYLVEEAVVHLWKALASEDEGGRKAIESTRQILQSFVEANREEHGRFAGMIGSREVRAGFLQEIGGEMAICHRFSTMEAFFRDIYERLECPSPERIREILDATVLL